MKSFRFQFIDLNESYTISTARTEISGYIGIRAPKGLKEAQLFTQGNEKHIRAMIGIPTAHWPDIAEAIAFNNGYDLYISAPPGNGAGYSSYFGGKYITKDGVLDYWHVTDGDNPNFEIAIPFANEKNYIDDLNNSEKEFDISDGNLKLNLTNISKKIFERVGFIDYNGTEVILQNGKLDAEDDTTGKFGSYSKINRTLSFNCGKLKDIIGYSGDDLGTDAAVIKVTFNETGNGDYNFFVRNSKVFYKTPDSDETEIVVGDSLYYGFINFVKEDDFIISEADPEKIYITYSSSDGLKYLNGASWAAANSAITKSITKVALAKVLAWEGNTEVDFRFGTSVLQPFAGLKDTLCWRYNIKNDTFMCVSQKSPYETKTTIKVSDIGYDKYLYNAKAPYATAKWFEENKEKITPEVLSVLSPYNEILVVAGTTADDLKSVPEGFEAELLRSSLKIWGFYDEVLTDLTEDYLTKDIYISGKYDDDTSDAAYDILSELRETIWYVDNGTNGKPLLKQRTEDGELLLRGNVNFNTVTISCSEEVEPGEITEGGEFTGSLSETGTDVNGANIYWPNILSDDSVTFIKVIPVNTIDSFDEYHNGFWRGTKIVDEAIDGDVYTSNIKGQRYCSYVNRLNIADGKLGCAWRNEYAGIINDSLIEAESDIYDDCIVFMEPTGQEQFRSKLVSLRESCHDLSTFISPKIITQAEFENPNKIIVNGKSYGVAQYIGEFKMYDTYTGKYYYCQPIGDVGLMLARINDKEYGGHAPAGTNENGLGGQLSRAVLEAKWKFKDSQLKILNKKNVNPITYDSKYGLMMRDHLSTADNESGSDWGWLGHSMSFDLCKREIRDGVMADQLFKRINGYYMSIRKKQIDAILEKRTSGKDPVWDYAYCNITGVNNGTTKAKRQFVIEVGCRVNVYAKTVVLFFKTLSQS